MVVKLCWAHAMLPWLVRVFDFKYQPVLLVRHPFAVVASQMRSFWRDETTSFKIPDCRFGEHFLKHREFLSTLKTKEEILVARWCLANQVPLSHPKNDHAWITVYYENLLMNPEHEIKRIFDRWQLPIPAGIMNKVRVPSAKTLENTITEEGPERQLIKWQSTYTDDQLERMMAVLSYFGSPGGYDLTPYPAKRQ